MSPAATLTTITTAEFLGALGIVGEKQDVGRTVDVTWEGEVQTAAAFRGSTLRKRVSATILTGITLGDLPHVRDAIVAGERDEVGSLPWGEWKVKGYVITHKGADYARMRVEAFHNVTYTVDGTEITRDEFATFLTPSAARRLLDTDTDKPEVITVKMTNLVSLG